MEKTHLSYSQRKVFPESRIPEDKYFYCSPPYTFHFPSLVVRDDGSYLRFAMESYNYSFRVVRGPEPLARNPGHLTYITTTFRDGFYTNNIYRIPPLDPLFRSDIEPPPPVRRAYYRDADGIHRLCKGRERARRSRPEVCQLPAEQTAEVGKEISPPIRLEEPWASFQTIAPPTSYLWVPASAGQACTLLVTADNALACFSWPPAADGQSAIAKQKSTVPRVRRTELVGVSNLSKNFAPSELEAKEFKFALVTLNDENKNVKYVEIWHVSGDDHPVKINTSRVVTKSITDVAFRPDGSLFGVQHLYWEDFQIVNFSLALQEDSSPEISVESYLNCTSKISLMATGQLACMHKYYNFWVLSFYDI